MILPLPLLGDSRPHLMNNEASLKIDSHHHASKPKKRLGYGNQ